MLSSNQVPVPGTQHGDISPFYSEVSHPQIPAGLFWDWNFDNYLNNP